MKKQYDYYECRWPNYEIVLYHDGEKVGVEKKSLFEYDQYIEELERQGYTRGYTKEDVENARKRYEYVYENRIERQSEGDKIMNFKERLSAKASNYTVEISKDRIEFIKSEMELSYGNKEYVIYLTRVDTLQDGVGNYGFVTLRIPDEFKFRQVDYYHRLIEELKNLGFEDKDIQSKEYDTFYRIQINW